jgi:acyl-CoA hydrolase
VSRDPASAPPARRVDDSRVEMTELAMPGDANALGNVFGGRVMALIDKAAAIVALRHCRSIVVTASVDSIDFISPVRLADIMSFHARVTQVFNTSMEVRVDVYSEEPRTGHRVLTTTAFATMVSLAGDGKPRPVPRLILETEDERAEAAAAEERRKQRLNRRSS